MLEVTEEALEQIKEELATFEDVEDPHVRVRMTPG